MSAREHSREGVVVGTNCVRGEVDETDCADHGGHGRRCGLCDHAQNPDLPGRLGHSDGDALSAAPATAAASAAADDELPGRIVGACGNDVPATAATAPAAATAGAPLGRARLICVVVGVKAPATTRMRASRHGFTPMAAWA